MLKTRVISALVGLVLLSVAAWLGGVIFAVGIFLMALLGIYEFFTSLSKGGFNPVRIVGYLSCLLVLFIGLAGKVGFVTFTLEYFRNANIFFFFLFTVFGMLSVLIIFMPDRYNLTDISLTFFGIFYIAFSFCFLVMTRNLPGGFYYIWLVFIGAWGTDTAAYFSGMLFGKNKILPVISPKKTLEGSIGGIIGCVALTVLYGVLLNHNAYVPHIPLYKLAILGLINGMISQIGDWAASAVKRYVNIKDYGNIMPGHGGVLDRFDSILFVSPLVYYYVRFFIM